MKMYAIASGFIIGKGLGLNANASIITRGLSEIIELGMKMGAKNTFMTPNWRFKFNLFIFKIQKHKIRIFIAKEKNSF